MFLFRLTQLIFFVLVLGLTSCSSQPITSPPLPQFQYIEIMASGETKKDLQADSTAKMVTVGTAGGATGGAAAGAVIGLACGPLAFICVPSLALTGGIHGAAGAATGAALSGKGLSLEQSRQINAVLKDLNSDLKPNEILHQSLSDALPAFVETVEAEAEARVQVRVKSLKLRQFEKQRVSLNIVADMTASWAFGGKNDNVQTNQYQCDTIIRAVKNLLVDPSKKFNYDIRECADHIAGLMARDLGYPVESKSD